MNTLSEISVMRNVQYLQGSKKEMSYTDKVQTRFRLIYSSFTVQYPGTVLGQ